MEALRPTGRVYFAQVNPREPEPLHLPAANVENWRSMSVDLHFGHSKSLSASLIRRSASKTFPQDRQ
jgi:hypothetical protein